MTATTTDALQRAIDQLGAVCVRLGIEETIIGGDGKGPNVTSTVQHALYAYHSDDVKGYCIATAPQLENLYAAREGRGPRPNLMPFCQAIMPAWWSPEQRAAIRWVKGEPTPFADTESAKRSRENQIVASEGALGPAAVVITADLETGEEIAA